MQDTDRGPDGRSPLKQFGITAATAALIFGLLWWVTAIQSGHPNLEWDIWRYALVAVGLSLAATLPASSLVRLVRGRAAMIGLSAYSVALFLFRASNSGTAPGVQKFYEICATTLPVLMLALVLDAGLFESLPSNPIALAFEIIALISGEGASLIGVTYETTSSGLFAITASAMISAFATLLISGIGRASDHLAASSNPSPLAQLFSTSNSCEKTEASEADSTDENGRAEPG